MGGDLAIIRTQEENNSSFILELIKKHERVTYYGAWLGLYRNPSAEDAFYWIDDTPLEGQFSAWASGHPSQVKERCGHMYAASDRTGKWNDKECSLSDARKSKAPVVLCQKGSHGPKAATFVLSVFYVTRSRSVIALYEDGIFFNYVQIF